MVTFDSNDWINNNDYEISFNGDSIKWLDHTWNFEIDAKEI